MPRSARIDIANQIYHVINRANAKVQIFKSESDYELFEETLLQAKKKFDVSIFSYIAMPNHIHLSPSVKNNGDLGKFMHWLTMTFTQRYHSRHGSTGTGHLFQSRYKSFIVRDDIYLLQLFLYIERNALKARLVTEAEHWRWSSLWIRKYGNNRQKKLLSDWPIDIPDNYSEMINDYVVTEREKIGLIDRRPGRPMKKL